MSVHLSPPCTEVVLSFPPLKAYVALAAEFVRTFCAEHTRDAAIVARAQLAAHELVENVVKYAEGGVCKLCARLEPLEDLGGGTKLTISTENEVAASALAGVDSYLRSLEQAQNPDQFYDARIAESAKRAAGSGLGLARIRAEAMMEVSHHAGRGVLSVSAALTLPR
jgi:hypothetical protein